MSLPTVNGANYPTHEEVRDAILRSIAYAFSRRSLSANVSPSNFTNEPKNPVSARKGR
jgi:hypothetical protein